MLNYYAVSLFILQRACLLSAKIVTGSTKTSSCLSQLTSFQYSSHEAEDPGLLTFSFSVPLEMNNIWIIQTNDPDILFKGGTNAIGEKVTHTGRDSFTLQEEQLSCFEIIQAEILSANEYWQKSRIYPTITDFLTVNTVAKNGLFMNGVNAMRLASFNHSSTEMFDSRIFNASLLHHSCNLTNLGNVANGSVFSTLFNSSMEPRWLNLMLVIQFVFSVVVVCL